MKKIILIFIACIGTVFAFYVGAMQRLTDGFSLSKIQSDLPYGQNEQIPYGIEDILSQPFQYLGKGSQMYVFESKDGKYVLKFFRHARFRMLRLPHLPKFLNQIQNQHYQQKLAKRDALFTSCQIAYTQLKEESGLVYLQLSKSPHLNQHVVLYDKLKRSIEIDVGQYEFLIQKKGELIYPYLTRLIKEGARDEAKSALFDLVRLLNIRFQKGVADQDAVIQKNSGFRQGKAMYLDIGQFSLDQRIQDPIEARLESLKITDDLSKWLKRQDPKLAEYLEKLL